MKLEKTKVIDVSLKLISPQPIFQNLFFPNFFSNQKLFYRRPFNIRISVVIIFLKNNSLIMHLQFYHPNFPLHRLLLLFFTSAIVSKIILF
jgi:hypothetical protein